MLVSGVVYTFAAMISMLGSVGAVAYGIYLCSITVTAAISGEYETASMFFLQAQIALIAAYTLMSAANKVARHSLILLDAIPDEDGEEEEYNDDD